MSICFSWFYRLYHNYITFQDDVMTWKRLLHYWLPVRIIHQWIPIIKSQYCGAWIFFLPCQPEYASEHFPRYWPLVGGIHRWPVNSLHKKSVTWSFDVFFNLHWTLRFRKQWRRRWFETPSRSFWRHCNAYKDVLLLLSGLSYSNLYKILHLRGAIHKTLYWWQYEFSMKIE